MAKYEFDEVKHRHTLDGKSLTGCTTILGVIAKPALIPWAANMVANCIKEKADFYHKPDSDINYYYVSEELLEEARTAHSKRKDKAGEWGTKLHAEVERYILNTMAIDGNAIDKTEYDPSISQFIEWAKRNNVKFLASEKNVYSEQMWTGGIVDFICEIDGKRWVGDIKSSGSGIYAENFWQTSGYDLMLQEMGEPPADGYLILNIKENGEFNEKRNISVEENQKAFLSCLNIYRTLEKIKSNL